MCKLTIRAVSWGVMVMAIVGSAPVATVAYPSFVSATPSVGSSNVRHAPVVRIKLSQSLFPGRTFARLTDRTDPLANFPSGHVSNSHPRTIVIRLSHPLSAGRYTVKWQACAYACHVGSEPPISAHYSFVVR